ncbi:hypothetical protein CTAYLR_004962 [Chrysophaeum taylorii]|uniref:Hexosyltransferase n=1 Tax=Chrysophaeum taylorii TaxID=2483200 RepID=A0AAD7UQJ0_9STRA|nr:hypothetical protein CTAYLR_004962 [Chrysophaeum taylorii]
MATVVLLWWCQVRGVVGGETYVAISSDRAMFAGLLSASESVLLGTRRPAWLRLVIVVPQHEEVKVEKALRCALEGSFLLGESCSGNTSRAFAGRGHWYETSSGARWSVVGFRATRHRHEVVASGHHQRLTSPFNYARLYLHKLPACWLPAEVERLVYLDADVYALGDVVELSTFVATPGWRIAAVTRPYRAVCETLINCKHPRVRAALLEKGIGDVEAELLDFNAGVMAYNVNAWREDAGLLKELESWIRLNRDIPIFKLGTNPPLVLTVRRSGIAPLDARWNCQDFDRSKRETRACDRADIIHYSGAQKPWHLAPNESAAMSWRLPSRSRACVYDFSRLGVKVRRNKRPPTDFIGPGMPTHLLKEHIKKGDIPGLKGKATTRTKTTTTELHRRRRKSSPPVAARDAPRPRHAPPPPRRRHSHVVAAD